MKLLRLLVLALLLSVTTATFAQAPPGSPPVGGPLPGLTTAQLAAFQAGLAEFTRRHDPGTGLGPVFNDNSCVACHGGPAPGAGSGRNVTRFGRGIIGGIFDPLERLGGSLLQDRAIPPAGTCVFLPEIVPMEANIRTGRRTQPLFGLGLVDAVTDQAFEDLARLQQSSPATAGRVNHVTELTTGRLRVGRFGWKAQVPTLGQFSADALLNEMGITNPTFALETCPQGDCSLLRCNPRPGLNDNGTIVRRLTDFQRFLAAPPRGPITPEVTAGEAVFTRIACGSCHVATWRTGPNEVRALDRVEFRPYSDFLLHDMGRLGDGIVQGEAVGREIRTAPLWGVNRQPRWLHDGRAATLDAAILAHDGQGLAASQAFARLNGTDRANLLAFLRSL
jgi:CxxC motif-containing protein (DUF1111 family)